MTNATASKFARDIIDDLKGNQYYKSPGILAQYVGPPRLTADKATQVASAILDDWDGAGYYKDPETLAQYLESNGMK